MANLDDELKKARERVERLEEKKRKDDEKKRARYVEAILSVLDEIEKNENENADQVSVRALMNRAKAKIREQDAKRKRAADKAAASRRKAKSEAPNEANSGATNESGSQPVGGGEQ
jgi:hypothetical protein